MLNLVKYVIIRIVMFIHTNLDTLIQKLALNGPMHSVPTAKELTETTAYYYPKASLTDAGKDYDGNQYAQVNPINGSAIRALRDMNRPGVRYYAIRLDMKARTLGIRVFPGVTSYAVPVAMPWRPEPNANPLPSRIDIQTIARIAYAFSKFLSVHGVTLRVAGNKAGTSYKCEPCAMFASEEDARQFAIDSRVGYYYMPDGTTRGTVGDYAMA